MHVIMVNGHTKGTENPTMQGLLGNLKNPNIQGLFCFFLKSDASEIGATVIHHMHASGVKAYAKSNQISNKCWLFFSQKKAKTGVLPLVSQVKIGLA